MEEDEREEILATVDNEGFDYAFCDYSEFKEIKDVEFHKARVKYVEAAKKLKEVIGLRDF